MGHLKPLMDNDFLLGRRDHGLLRIYNILHSLLYNILHVYLYDLLHVAAGEWCSGGD